MPLACALVVAVTITSSDVGEFISLPAWAPKEVESANTPGSPETVVDELKPVVTTEEWAFGDVRWLESDGTYTIWHTSPIGIGDVPQPTFVAGSGWYVYDTVTALSRLFNKDRTYQNYYSTETQYVGSDADDDTLTVNVTLNYSFINRGTWYYGSVPFTWTLTANRKRHEMKKTGRKTVQGMRLCPEALSSYYSTFDAYLERLYYLNAGERNSWIRKDLFGPTAADYRFRFDLPNSDVIQMFYPETNREVKTTRVIHYDSLWEIMNRLCGYGVPDFARAVWRPGWLFSCEDSDDYYYGSDSVSLSSTAFDGMDCSYPFPDYTWVLSSALDDMDWNRMMLEFSDTVYKEDAAHDDLINWGSLYYDRKPLRMLDSVNFGEPPFDASSSFWQDYPMTVRDESHKPDVTTEDVLSKSYGDKSLITNDFKWTCRLIPHDLGRINQVLAACDRSYVSTEDLWRQDGDTNTVPVFEMTYVASERRMHFKYDSYTSVNLAQGGMPFIDASGGISYYVDGDYSLPAPTMYEVVTNDRLFVVSDTNTTATVCVSPTGSSVEVGAIEHTDSALAGYMDASIADLLSGVPFPENVDTQLVYVSINSPRLFVPMMPYDVPCYVIDATVSAPGGPFEVRGVASTGRAPAELRVTTIASYSRNYRRTRISRGLLPGDGFRMYPGSFARLKGQKASLLTIAAVASAHGTGGHPLPDTLIPGPAPLSGLRIPVMSWLGSAWESENSFYVKYRFGTDTYKGRGEYHAAVSNSYLSAVADQCNSEVSSHVGASWDDPNVMLDMSESDVSGWIGSMSLTNGQAISLNVQSQPLSYVNGTNGMQEVDHLLVSADEYGAVQSAVLVFSDGSEAVCDATNRVIVGSEGYGIEPYVPSGAKRIDRSESYGARADGRAAGTIQADWNWNCLRLGR